MIQISHITKSYGKKENANQVLKDISLEIADKEFVAVLGPSGLGKSTLLNIMSGLEPN